MITILIYNDYANILPDISACLCRWQCLYLYPYITDAFRLLAGYEDSVVCHLLAGSFLVGDSYADPSYRYACHPVEIHVSHRFGMAGIYTVHDFCFVDSGCDEDICAVTESRFLYGYYNYRHPQVNKIDVSLDKPIEGNGINIVAVSDVHLGYGTGKAMLKEYVDMINAQHPDLILIGGDLIDNSLTPLYKENMAEELAQLKAPLGIYMVPGNHEYISGIDESVRFLKDTPIQLLRDSVVTLPNGVQIIGRDDRSNRSRHSLPTLLKQADRSKPIILLDHQPYNLAKTDSLGIDLQFSGHTHHGQIWPISWVTDRIYEQSHGYRKWSQSHIYVSSGLSLWGPPFRIGTNSDMAVFHLNQMAK